MTKEALLDWVLDTISEGGYSFNELREYFSKNGVPDDVLEKSISTLFSDNLISVFRVVDECEIDQDASAQSKTIEDFIELANQQMTGIAEYFFRITEIGTVVLQRRGIYH